jgi:long-chain-fatty-acid--[acyl-carrier-protein] ligase
MSPKFYATIYRRLLKLRYRIEVENVSILEDKALDLFFANHQATVDPQIILSTLLNYKNVAPFVVQQYYDMPLFRWVMRKLHAIPLPDFDRKQKEIDLMKRVKIDSDDRFKFGYSLILYPSGQLCNNGIERIGNKQSAYNLVRSVDAEKRIILVKISGLWGSMWSRYKKGKTPSLFLSFLKSFFIILLNGVFFVPKRTVKVTFMDITKDAISNAQQMNRREFNAWLESIFNSNGPETLRRVPYFFW